MQNNVNKKNMKLFFKQYNGENRFLSNVESIEEAFVLINRFLLDHNFKSYYKRVCGTNENSIWVDVGSHTEFFVITGVTFDDYKKVINKNKEEELN